MKAEFEKQYVPVGHFERQTSLCPTYIAWRVLDEARNYFRREIPEAYARQLARRAERVLAAHPGWRRQFQRESGREQLMVWMRHWLLGVLGRENPALFRQLPESFKTGAPLPLQPSARATKIRRQPRPARHARRLVHGCELLVI